MKSIIFKRILLPIFWGLLISILVTILSSYYDPNFWDRFLSWRNSTIILATIVLSNLNYEVFINRPDFYKAAEQLNKMLNRNRNIPTLRNYSLIRFHENLQDINQDVNALLNQGLPNQTLSQKLEIITNIIKENCQSIDKYLATSYVPPSKVFKEHETFFKAQAKYLKRVKDKRRIVIISEQQLISEVTDNKNYLEKFINWHSKNDFLLRFLINRDLQFEKVCDNMIRRHNIKEVLTDFAVIGNKLVYGEVTADEKNQKIIQEAKKILEKGGLTKEARGIGDLGYLKLLHYEFHDINTIKEYEQLFNNLWNEWIVDRWAMMSLEQIRLLILLKRYSENKFIEDTIKHYKKFGIDGNGKNCFNSIINLIKTSNENIYAVDIVTLKQDIDQWLKNEDYITWMNATISRNAASKRIYIFKEPIVDQYLKDELLQKVFRKQENNGVEIHLVNGVELLKADVPIYDFCLVDKKLCFGLEWTENFSSNTVSVKKNLLNPILFNRFLKAFKRIEQSTLTERISYKTNEEVLNFLKTLKW